MNKNIWIQAHVLSGLNKEWEKVLHLGVKKNISKGTVVDSFNPDIFGYLYKGQLSLSSVSWEGKKRVAFYLEDGCICLENKLFHRYSDIYMPEFVATKDCVLYLFPKKLLTSAEFAQENPELMLSVIRSEAIKTGALYVQLSEKAAMDSISLIARILMRQYLKVNKTTFKLGFSQTELSLMLNIHRNTLCRNIRELREAGIIGKCTKNCLEILDLQRLEELAQV